MNKFLKATFIKLWKEVVLSLIVIYFILFLYLFYFLIKTDSKDEGNNIGSTERENLRINVKRLLLLLVLERIILNVLLPLFRYLVGASIMVQLLKFVKHFKILIWSDTQTNSCRSCKRINWPLLKFFKIINFSLNLVVEAMICHGTGWNHEGI